VDAVPEAVRAIAEDRVVSDWQQPSTAPIGHRVLVKVQHPDGKTDPITTIGVRGKSEWVLIGCWEGLKVLGWQELPR